MDQTEIYNNIIAKWEQTGYIGRVHCWDRTHAKKVAWAVSIKLNNKNEKINTTASPTRQGAEPLTACQSCCQLKLFQINN